MLSDVFVNCFFGIAQGWLLMATGVLIYRQHSIFWIHYQNKIWN